MPAGSAVAQERPLTLLPHVPKCAGTTVEDFIEKNFPERTLSPWLERGIFGCKLRKHVLPAHVDFSQIDFVVGHDFRRYIVDYFPGRSYRSAVLLREPVERVLSEYNYHMQRYREVGWKVIPFGLWYRCQPYNHITEFLLRRHLGVPRARMRIMSDQTRLGIAVELLRSFWYVGRHTQCGELIARIAKERGVSPEFERKNTTTETIVSLDDLSSEMRETLHRDTSVDRALFERFLGSGTEKSADQDGRIRQLLKEALHPSSVWALRRARGGMLLA